MKALKSKLAEKLLRDGVRIPLHDGAKFEHNGTVYSVTPFRSILLMGATWFRRREIDDKGNPRSDPRP